MWHFRTRNMKTILYLILIFSLLTFGSCRYPLTIQKNRNGKLTLERDFANEGEHSAFMSRKVFREKRHDESYPKYTGKIETNESKDEITISYDSVVIRIGLEDKKYLEIFKTGLIWPQMLGCWSSEGHGIFIRELYDLQIRHKRRFEFWVWQPNEMNPQSFLIELTNNGKFKKNNLEEFLKHAKVTYVYKGGIII